MIIVLKIGKLLMKRKCIPAFWAYEAVNVGATALKEGRREVAARRFERKQRAGSGDFRISCPLFLRMEIWINTLQHRLR